MNKINYNMPVRKEGPILITGTFRSGTTLISQILKSHSKVNLLYDSVNFMRFSYGRYSPLDKNSNTRDLLEEIRDRISSRWDVEIDINKIHQDLDKMEKNYANVYSLIMRNCLNVRDENIIWGEKTTMVWTKIPDFFEMFPDARVIHIIRDPRAVVASWRKMTHAPGKDYLDAVFNCIGSMNKMADYTHEYENKKYMPVIFEELVREPEEVVKRICLKLGLEYEENMLSFTSYTNKKGISWAGNSMFDDNLSSITTKTTDLWKNNLDKSEISFIEFFAGDQMKKFGYPLVNSHFDNDTKTNIMATIYRSKLLSESALKFLICGEGVEQFPSDPLNEKNWDKNNKW